MKRLFFAIIGCCASIMTLSIAACSTCQPPRDTKKPILQLAEPCKDNTFEINPGRRNWTRFIFVMDLGAQDAKNGKCRNAKAALEGAGYECGSEKECEYNIETYHLGYESVVEEVCTKQSAKKIGLDDAKNPKAKEFCFKLRICPNWSELKNYCIEGYKQGAMKP